MSIAEKLRNRQAKLAVVGLGYVGLPLANAFSKKADVIGFDTNKDKISQYQEGIDLTNEVGSSALKDSNITFTTDATMLQHADFLIVTVPTPVTNDNTPDLQPIRDACLIIGANLKTGAIISFESTVYPGVTEDVCIPLFEKVSGLHCGSGFFVCYSPERVNPGDTKHRIENMIKIVSGTTDAVAQESAEVYKLIINERVYIAKSIKVAESAKLAENAQRDINISFMNELSIILNKMHVNTKDVIDAMNTKWNALGFTPGLVGGHCIGVDPYYLIYKAQELHYSSPLLQTSRTINNSMGYYVAEQTVKQLIQQNKIVKGSKTYILGLSYKENCPDIRNTLVTDIMHGLQDYGVQAFIADPVVHPTQVQKELGITLVDQNQIHNADCIILAVAHAQYLALTAKDLSKMYGDQKNKVLIDIKNIYSKEKMEQNHFSYWSL